MRDYNKIAFGATMATFANMLILMMVYGNDKEVACLFPVLVISILIFSKLNPEELNIEPMSRTRRKGKKGKTHRDGKGNYQCRCEWCMSLDKMKHRIKIVEDEIKKHLNK